MFIEPVSSSYTSSGRTVTGRGKSVRKVREVVADLIPDAAVTVTETVYSSLSFSAVGKVTEEVVPDPERVLSVAPPRDKVAVHDA